MAGITHANILPAAQQPYNWRRSGFGKGDTEALARVAVASMTGFARVADDDGIWRWTWEARSVNGRGLDLRSRLPTGLDRLEAHLRAEIARRLQRGSLSLSLSLEPVGETGGLRIDHARLEAYLALAAELQTRHGLAPPRADSLLALRGVIEAEERRGSDAAQVSRDSEIRILASLTRVIDDLATARGAEGMRLATILSALLDEIAALTARARDLAAQQPSMLRDRLMARLADLTADLPSLPPERLAQEVAMLAQRADAQEELDRLDAHVAQARILIASTAPAGRKLEFLAQEFNREANTLCAKSSDLELTRCGLDLKAAIDRLREQSANVE
jgi:uncharacterized protein (TIGR00255 family)